MKFGAHVLGEEMGLLLLLCFFSPTFFGKPVWTISIVAWDCPRTPRSKETPDSIVVVACFPKFLYAL
jgi:hypothetical protein